MVCGAVCSSECDDTVGRTVRGKSHVIVSANDVVSVCNAVALAIDAVGAESSDWVELFDWWAGISTNNEFEVYLPLDCNCVCVCVCVVKEGGKKEKKSERVRAAALQEGAVNSPQLVVKVWVAERGMGREKFVRRVL